MRAVLVVLGLLVGCGPKMDPLAAQRELLSTIEQTPPPRGWAPDASLVVGRPLVDRMVALGVDRLTAEVPAAISVPVPLLGAIQVSPGLERPGVGLSEGACDACVRADVAWRGQADLDLGGGSMRGLPWAADTTTTVALMVVDHADGQRLELRPLAEATDDVRVRLDGLPPAYSRVVTNVVRGLVREQLAEGPLSEPVTLLTLSHDDPLRLRDVRLDLADGVRADLSLATLTSGQVGALPDPGDGWAAVVPAETLLGLLEAAALREGVVRGYTLAPTSLALDDGRFELALRVYRVGRGERYRDYAVSGVLGMDPSGRIGFQVDDAQEVGGVGGFGLFGGAVRERILGFFEGGRALSVPGRRELRVGDEVWTLRVGDVVADDGRLIVRGAVDTGRAGVSRRP